MSWLTPLESELYFRIQGRGYLQWLSSGEKSFTSKRAGPPAGTHRGSGDACVGRLGAPSCSTYLPASFPGSSLDECQCQISHYFTLDIMFYKDNSNDGTKYDLEVGQDWRWREQLGGYCTRYLIQHSGVGMETQERCNW